jgi:hypothetical protein
MTSDLGDENNWVQSYDKIDKKRNVTAVDTR